MRYKMLVILSLFLLAFFSIDSIAPDWSGDSGDQTADQLFSSGQGSWSGLSGQAQAARAEWSQETGSDILGTSANSTLSSEATNPKEARNEDQNQNTSIQTTENNPTTTVQPETSSSAEPLAAAGSWSLVLNDSVSHTATLTLFQNGDAVYGTGNINVDANSTLVAAASGTVTGDKINLDIVSLGKVRLYRVSMNLNGDSAAGSYAAYSPSSTLITGIANGERVGFT